jgi:hypothetical protein
MFNLPVLPSEIFAAPERQPAFPALDRLQAAESKGFSRRDEDHNLG